MTSTSTTASRDTLRRHGRSFHWAGHFLSSGQLEDGARLYHICRQVDDIADDAQTGAERQSARNVLVSLQQRLAGSAQGPSCESSLAAKERDVVRQLDADIRHLFADDRLARQAMQDLISTMIVDLSPVRMADERALLTYAFGAAGTVGVMMCQLLDARQRERALPFAMDLGIAMQMTNMARDVLEDAERDRVYVPASWMAGDIMASDIAQGVASARHQAWLGARHLVERAEAYYQSGQQGLAYLPWRPRLAIGIALRVYRDIGRRLLTLEENTYWQRRVRVPGWAKAGQSLLALPSMWRQGEWPRHDERLHRPIAGSLVAYQSTSGLAAT
ncbi:MAG: phytoene/squalene synthase family protein [Pseudomonadota bacterium]